MGARSVYDWAEEYLEKGYQVIPLEVGGKKPVIAWQKYQKERVTKNEIRSWFPEGSRYNLGVVTGALSSLVVIDFDPRHGGMANKTPLVYQGEPCYTGGGGTHWYCRSSGSMLGNFTGILPGVDIRGEGGYVVAPPSKTTKDYRFESGMVPDNASLPEVGTTGILEIINKRGLNKPKDLPKRDSSAGSFMRLCFLSAKEGSRNETAARMAGSIIRSTHNYECGLDILRLWNKSHCHPSLELDELDAVYLSIWTKQHGSNK